jgi:hypothetical protein
MEVIYTVAKPSTTRVFQRNGRFLPATFFNTCRIQTAESQGQVSRYVRVMVLLLSMDRSVNRASQFNDGPDMSALILRTW